MTTINVLDIHSQETLVEDQSSDVASALAAIRITVSALSLSHYVTVDIPPLMKLFADALDAYNQAIVDIPELDISIAVSA